MSFCFGEHLKISLFGASHAPSVGAVVEGLPAGEPLDREALAAFLRRRAPGREGVSPRREPDEVEFLSGLSQGKTTGEPLRLEIRNRDIRPEDYADFSRFPRPSHADYPALVRGGRVLTGSGTASGRMTAPLCAAGGICLQILARQGIAVGAHLLSVGAVSDRAFNPVAPELSQIGEDFPVLSREAGEAMRAAIARAGEEGDSLGGVIECAATGLPVGTGEPFFDGWESLLGHLLFAVPGVKGVSFGSGFAGAALRGSENNDPYLPGTPLKTETNRAGGLLGGYTTGMPLLFSLACKPTPSIAREQKTVDLETGEPALLRIRGRHDPCFAVRAVPVAEACLGLVAGDLLWRNGHGD